MLPPTHKSLNEMHHNLLLSKMAYSLNSLHSQCTDRPIKIKSYKSDTTCSEAAIRHKIMNWFIICIYIYIFIPIYIFIYIIAKSKFWSPVDIQCVTKGMNDESTRLNSTT